MSCLIDIDHDDMYEELYCEVVKARKRFRCGECKYDIHVGDMYEIFVGKLDGIHTHRTCSTCLSIRNKFCCNWTFNGLYEDIYDAINNDYKLEDCILMRASKEEYKKLSKFIMFLQEDPYNEDEEDE